MPFLDDSGPRPEEERGILWRSTALIGEQLERMILLNIAWAIHSAPVIVAWAYPNFPSWLRVAFLLYSAFAFIPATATLFASLSQVCDGIPLDFEMVTTNLREQFAPSFLKLLPLYSLFYWLYLLSTFAAQKNFLLLDVFSRLLILTLAVFSVHWGGLFVQAPHLSALKIASASAALFWRKPAATLLTALLCFIALIIGIISIGGMFLIVPVLIALIQIQSYRNL
jgi:hypothetical protein